MVGTQKSTKDRGRDIFLCRIFFYTMDLTNRDRKKGGERVTVEYTYNGDRLRIKKTGRSLNIYRENRPYDIIDWITMTTDQKNQFWDDFRKENLNDNYSKAKFISSSLGEAYIGGKFDEFLKINKIKMVNKLDDAIQGTFKLDPKVIDEILAMAKGSRPNPSTYLPQEYITSHLAKFDGGVTKIAWEAPTRPVGPPGGTFVMPKSVADDLIAKSGGDVSKLEELLSLEPGSLGDAPVRIDIAEPTGLRMPDGNELGANDQWIPGGFTGGGIPEATIDQTPLDKVVVTELFK